MRSATRMPALLALALSVILASMAARPASAEPQVTEVAPFLECVVFDPATNLLTAGWGYRNGNATAQTVAVGQKNTFGSAGDDVGQPTVFLPGEHHFVFSTVVDVTQTPWLQWTLTTNRTTVAANDPRLYCGRGRGAMIWRGAWDGAAHYRVNDVVAHQESVWRATLDSTDVAPGQSTAWEVVVPDSVPSTSQVYTLPASGTLTIVDASVTPDSVIILQYVVDGPRVPVVRALAATNIASGRFTAVGAGRRAFRYVVFN